MTIVLVSSDLDWRAPTAAMLRVRAVDVLEADDVFDGVSMLRTQSRAVLILHGLSDDDVRVAVRGASRSGASASVYVVGHTQVSDVKELAFGGRFAVLVDSIVALRADAHTAATTPAIEIPPPSVAGAAARLETANHGSYHALLGVPRNADDTALGRAFAESTQWLADATSAGVERSLLTELAAAIAEAYDVLEDPASRALYERGLPGAS